MLEGTPATTTDAATEGAATPQQQAPAPTPAEVAKPATPATQPQAPAGQQAPAQGESSSSLPDDPAALKAEIARLRKENASDRTNAKATAAQEARDALAQEIGKALGLVDADEAPDPAKLTEQVQTAQTQARQAAVELAVYRAAATHQGDPAALLDSRTFLAKVANLDPADAEFDKQIGDAIKAAVTTNTKLKAVQVAGSSSVDHAGGTGENAITPEQFAAMGGAERNALFQTNPTLYRQLAGTDR